MGGPPESERARLNGRIQIKLTDCKSLTSDAIAQLQLLCLLAASLARCERKLLGRATEQTKSVITRALDEMRRLEGSTPT
jgi:hypothetical protein